MLWWRKRTNPPHALRENSRKGVSYGRGPPKSSFAQPPHAFFVLLLYKPISAAWSCRAFFVGRTNKTNIILLS